MTRRKTGIVKALVQAQREIEQQNKAQLREQQRAAKELERRRAESQRAREKLAKATAKEQKRLYTESRLVCGAKETCVVKMGVAETTNFTHRIEANATRQI